MIRFMLLIGLAIPLLIACEETTGEGGGNVAPAETEAEAAAPTATEEVDQADIDIPDDLEETLARENAEHYTFACVYSYDFTSGGWTQADIARGLPVPAIEQWGVGTLGIGQGGADEMTYVTLYDAEGEPTDATEFTRIDEAERVCFLPAS